MIDRGTEVVHPHHRDGGGVGRRFQLRCKQRLAIPPCAEAQHDGAFHAAHVRRSAVAAKYQRRVDAIDHDQGRRH